MRKYVETIAERASARLLANSVLWANVKSYDQPRVRVGQVVAQPSMCVVARGHHPLYTAIRRSLERSVRNPHGLLAEIGRYQDETSDLLVQHDLYGNKADQPLTVMADRERLKGGLRRWGTPDRFDPSRFLYHLIRELRPETMIEFGTAHGRSGLHMIAALVENEAGHLHTVELDAGRRQAAGMAFDRFFPGSTRVTSIGGDISDLAGSLAADLSPLDFVFEDGPHNGTVTLAAFRATVDHLLPGGVYIIDDIQMSVEQEQAWAEIRGDPRVAGSLEINGRHGICVRGE